MDRVHVHRINVRQAEFARHFGIGVARAAGFRNVEGVDRRLRIFHRDNHVRVAVAGKARIRGVLGVDADRNVLGFIDVAARAIDDSGVIRVRKAFDVRVAGGARQATVDAGFLFLDVDVDAMAGLIRQALLTVAG